MYRKQCLSSEQITNLESSVKGLEDSIQRKVVMGIKNMQITPSNYQDWIDRINTLKDKGESDE